MSRLQLFKKLSLSLRSGNALICLFIVFGDGVQLVLDTLQPSEIGTGLWHTTRPLGQRGNERPLGR